MGVIFGWLLAEFGSLYRWPCNRRDTATGVRIVCWSFHRYAQPYTLLQDAATGQHPARRQMPECAKSLKTVDP